jgi:hypothetical protein
MSYHHPLLLALFTATPCFAGQVVLTWGDPAYFTDIEPGVGTPKATLASMQRAFTGSFSAAATGLPEGYTFKADIRNVDLAGQVNPPQAMNPNLISTRVMTANYFPTLTLDYALTDASGKIQTAGENIIITDMDYLSRTNSVASSIPYFYEDQMIRNWFNRSIMAAVK